MKMVEAKEIKNLSTQVGDLNEIWKDIPEYEGLYQVSSYGRIKSLDRIIVNNGNLGMNKISRLKSKVLSKRISNGYNLVSLCKDGKMKQFKASRLVYATFVGDILDDMVIDHINNISSDDRLENLQMISNRLNVSKDRKPKSKMTGSYKSSRTNKWFAQIVVNKKTIYIGQYDTEVEAHEAYINKLKELEHI